MMIPDGIFSATYSNVGLPLKVMVSLVTALNQVLGPGVRIQYRTEPCYAPSPG